MSKIVGLFFKLSEFFPVKILKSVCASLVLPHILYGAEINSGAPYNIQERIIILQREISRSINFLA